MQRSSNCNKPLGAPILPGIGLVCVCVFGPASAGAPRYEPNWESLDKRPTPEWFEQARFGVFIVWGPYSVPAWAPKGEYAEWYGYRMRRMGSATHTFHVKAYGEDFRYEQFGPMLTAEMWDPDFWADLFVRSGAKYVVMTANYHDGYCLWPSPYHKGWNSVDVGPKRDLLGEMTEAVRKRGLKMGIYYSLYEWFHPLWLKDRERFVTEHYIPQFKDVVTRYKPSILFMDGEWEMHWDKWRSEEVVAWLFNESPVREEVVINDRWGKCRGKHGGYWTSEYGGHTKAKMGAHHIWEENRGMGSSYGYNRNESIFDYRSAEELIRLLSTTVGNGGNLLLCVGPTADGRIPVIMQERLLQIGAWLDTNGDAIYGAKAGRIDPKTLSWGTCTAKPGRLYLHLHKIEEETITVPGWKGRVPKAYLLARPKAIPVAARPTAAGLTLPVPSCAAAMTVPVIAVETADADLTSVP